MKPMFVAAIPYTPHPLPEAARIAVYLYKIWPSFTSLTVEHSPEKHYAWGSALEHTAHVRPQRLNIQSTWFPLAMNIAFDVILRLRAP